MEQIGYTELIEYLTAVSSVITTRISSTESALVLRELYCDTYFDPIDNASDTCLGAIANRIPNEPVIEDTILNSLKEYTYLCVKELLGVTYTEYMDMTHIMRIQLREYLEPIAEKKAQSLQDIENGKKEIEEMVNAR